MRVSDVCQYLESLAPLSLQEDYDNAGLLVGDKQMEVTGVVVALDALEAVLDEAIQKDANMVVTHHPIVFSGLKKITGRNYIERVVIKAIKHDIALYAIHTNLDNVAHGVNAIFAEKLGLTKKSILQPGKSKLFKLQTYVPERDLATVRDAMFSAGAGHIGNYSHCSFNTAGKGTFLAQKGANPHVGEKGVLHYEPEMKVELVLPDFAMLDVVKAMKQAHPYEEVAYDLIPVKSDFKNVGAGMLGELPEALETMDFLHLLKDTMRAGCVRHTAILKSKVQKIAICGGSGSFLLDAAKRAGADVFVTADYKYHQFFDADGDLVIADIGHYESEQFTTDYLVAQLRDKFPKFAVHFTDVNTNPIKYI